MSYYSNADDIRLMRREYLDSIREVLAPQYRRLGDQQIAEILRNSLENMSHAEQEAFAAYSLQNAQENFFSDIGRSLAQAAPGILRTVAPIAQAALPMVGTLIGGPAGTAVGGALGGLIGNLAGGGSPGAPAPRPIAPTAPPGITAPLIASPPPPLPSPAVNPAAAQLMSLINNPQFIQALMGQVLGRAGNGTATVQTAAQQTAIPFAALMNTIGELAERAAEESVQTGSFESESYLMNGRGQYRVADPSSREQRADAVMELLNEDYYYRRNTASSYNEHYHDGNEYDQVSEWLVNAGLIR